MESCFRERKVPPARIYARECVYAETNPEGFVKIDLGSFDALEEMAEVHKRPRGPLKIHEFARIIEISIAHALPRRGAARIERTCMNI